MLEIYEITEALSNKNFEIVHWRIEEKKGIITTQYFFNIDKYEYKVEKKEHNNQESFDFVFFDDLERKRIADQNEEEKIFNFFDKFIEIEKAKEDILKKENELKRIIKFL